MPDNTHDRSCESQLFELVSLNSVAHFVLQFSCPSCFPLVCCSDYCLNTWTCVSATDRYFSIVDAHSAMAQEKVPLGHTSAQFFHSLRGLHRQNDFS